ncbi:MAG TPA: DUF1003 domain-containing protein [Rhodopila sp.]
MPSIAPPVPPSSIDSLSTSLQRNIHALEERREREAANATREERIANGITTFTGSMWFVYLHLVIYSVWIMLNLGIVPGVAGFDRSFGMLAMEASVEAIFLSTFVLIAQNRMTAAASQRADLDLQISLLTEHELTKLVELVTEIRGRLDLDPAPSPEIEEITRDVAPEAVLNAIEERRRAD